MYKQLSDFMEEHVYPNEAEFNRHQASEHCWSPHPLVEEIKVDLPSTVNDVTLHHLVFGVNHLSASFNLMHNILIFSDVDSKDWFKLRLERNLIKKLVVTQYIKYRRRHLQIYQGKLSRTSIRIGDFLCLQPYQNLVTPERGIKSKEALLPQIVKYEKRWRVNPF